MRRPVFTAGLVICAALLLAACGSDEGGADEGAGNKTTGAAGAAGEQGESSEAFLAAVDQTCVEHALAVNELSERLGVPQGFRDTAAYDQARAGAAAAQADAAAALEPPAEIADDYKALVFAFYAYANAYQKNADLSAAGNRGA